MIHDFKEWKIPRMIRKEEDYQAVKHIYYMYKSVLKECFITAAARGIHFPNIHWNDYSQFALEANIYD